MTQTETVRLVEPTDMRKGDTLVDLDYSDNPHGPIYVVERGVTEEPKPGTFGTAFVITGRDRVYRTNERCAKDGRRWLVLCGDGSFGWWGDEDVENFEPEPEEGADYWKMQWQGANDMYAALLDRVEDAVELGYAIRGGATEDTNSDPHGRPGFARVNVEFSAERVQRYLRGGM